MAQPVSNEWQPCGARIARGCPSPCHHHVPPPAPFPALTHAPPWPCGPSRSPCPRRRAACHPSPDGTRSTRPPAWGSACPCRSCESGWRGAEVGASGRDGVKIPARHASLALRRRPTRAQAAAGKHRSVQPRWWQPPPLLPPRALVVIRRAAGDAGERHSPGTHPGGPTRMERLSCLERQ